MEQVDVARLGRLERPVAARGEAEVGAVFDDLHSVAVTFADKHGAPGAGAVVRDDDPRERQIVSDFRKREHRVERRRDLLLVVPTNDDDVDYRHRPRCCRYGQTNVSIWPSRTAWTLPVSTLVRWSLTSVYGCRTYERISEPHSLARRAPRSSANFASRCSSSR